MKKVKILHITDQHFRHNARLFYSTGKKLNNGLLLNGHNVVNISDRDLTYQKKSLFDFGSRNFLIKTIVQNIENFKPDLILMGHVDRVDYDSFHEIKQKYNSIRYAQWFLDPLNINGPDYKKNKDRFFLKYQFSDANFVTTATDELNFVDKNKTFFIPNPIDPTIDVYRNYKSEKKIDLFLAISHGQHRGVLKKNFIDARMKIIKKLNKKIKCNIFGDKKNPIWGQNFFDELSKCSIGLNLSRGTPIKYYSSDRISSLLGNGLLTFIHQDCKFQDFFKKNEIVTYKNIYDLNKKLIYYCKNKKKLRKIASNGCKKAHQIFNNKLIAKYIVEKSFNTKSKFNVVWADA